MSENISCVSLDDYSNIRINFPSLLYLQQRSRSIATHLSCASSILHRQLGACCGTLASTEDKLGMQEYGEYIMYSTLLP